MSGAGPVAVTIAAAPPTQRLDMPEPRLVDTFGRVATDLRVSLTDRCNLRCTYCMPAEGMAWLPRREVLTDDEVVRLVGIAIEHLGVTEIRFTGGEPMLRPGLERILARTTALQPRPSVSLTTNGIGLEKRADALAASGLRRINVSLDTLRADRFRELTRRDRLDDVLRGLHAARRAGLHPVKVNTVLMRGVNDDEAASLLSYCLEHGFELRFIEQMPLDADHIWRREHMITAAEILDQLGQRFDLTPVGGPRGSAPAERWLVDGGPATVGIIASVTRSFCSTCNRTRLTADGQVRTCLFAQHETNLRDMLRAGADDDQLADMWRIAMWGKGAGHTVNAAGFVQPLRSMSAIGG